MGRLRFGLFVTGLPREHSDPQAYAAGVVELTRVARDVGFDSVIVGQHLVSGPFQYLQPLPLLARLVPESGDLQLVTGILLLPLFNPIDVAEQMATVDVLSGGRTVLGIGAGYREEEFAAFGVDPSRRLGRIRESLQVIRGLWSGQPVSFHGEHFSIDVPGASMVPLQPGGPPVWIAAQTERSVRRVVGQGDHPFIGPRIDLTTLRGWGLDEGLFDGAGTVALRRELHLSTAGDEQAWDEAVHHIGGRYEVYRRWGQEQGLDASSEGMSMRRYLDDRVIVGTPDRAAELLASYEEAGVTDVALRCSWPTLGWEGIVEQVELTGRHVIGQLRG